jgi:hypothetical protein
MLGVSVDTISLQVPRRAFSGPDARCPEPGCPRARPPAMARPARSRVGEGVDAAYADTPRSWLRWTGAARHYGGLGPPGAAPSLGGGMVGYSECGRRQYVAPGRWHWVPAVIYCRFASHSRPLRAAHQLVGSTGGHGGPYTMRRPDRWRCDTWRSYSIAHRRPLPSACLAQRLLGCLSRVSGTHQGPPSPDPRVHTCLRPV